MRIMARFSGWHRGLLYEEGRECDVEEEVALNLIEAELAESVSPESGVLAPESESRTRAWVGRGEDEEEK